VPADLCVLSRQMTDDTDRDRLASYIERTGKYPREVGVNLLFRRAVSSKRDQP
jgi:hypothetical protein